MTPEEIVQIRERWSKATEGPYRTVQSDIRLLYVQTPDRWGHDDPPYRGGIVLSNCYQADHVGLRPGDAEFLGNVWQDTKALLDALTELQALRQQQEKHREWETQVRWFLEAVRLSGPEVLEFRKQEAKALLDTLAQAQE